MKKGIQKDRIRDAVKNGNHAADMQQDDVCFESAEDGNSSQIEMMLQEEYQSASSSKKLKSFHYKDDKAAGHAMEHGNDSGTKQRRVALNSQYNLELKRLTSRITLTLSTGLWRNIHCSSLRLVRALPLYLLF